MNLKEARRCHTAGRGIIVTDRNNIVALPTLIPDKFLDWNSAQEAGFFTRTALKYDHGRTVISGQRSHTRYQDVKLLKPEEWREFQQRLNQQRAELADLPKELERLEARFRQFRANRRDDKRIELVIKEIPLFHISHTQPGNFRERTRAIIEFGRRFWRQSQSANYIQRNLRPDLYPGKWFTRDFTGKDNLFEAITFLDERKLLAHLNQREIYGVKANPNRPQWWCAADLDLHIEKRGDPALFMKQVEAVLSYLQGQGWIVCLGKDSVNGIHLLKLLDKPLPLNAARNVVRNVLLEVSERHPELEAAAQSTGRKPLRDAEIFPSENQGFRLPLGMGYTALLSKPLELIQYHTYQEVPLFGADITSFMNWDGSEMPLDAKLQFIRDRLPGEVVKNSSNRLKLKTQSSDRKSLQAIAQQQSDKKLLGEMKGRYRKVLVDFYSGEMQVPGSLQTGILLGANALWAQKFPVEDRSEYLLERLMQIEVTNPAFSSRLANGDAEALLDDITHVVETSERLREEPGADQKIGKSNQILRNWATAMERSGFVFGDPATWNTTWSNSESGPSWFSANDLSEDDLSIIANNIAPAMVCSKEIAVEAVVKMVQLAALKDKHGHGMSREYRRALLTDLGVSCQENSKLARCWDLVEEAGFIYTKQRHVFNQDRQGRARGYAVGRRVAERIHNEQLDQAKLPDWLHQAVDQYFAEKWAKLGSVNSTLSLPSST